MITDLSYFFNMKGWRWVVVAVVAVAATGSTFAAAQDKVPVYTTEDLDRMFGPAPRSPSEPVDKSRPEDWQWVEQFLDRQYSRIEADRTYELNTRTLDIAERRTAPASSYPYYGVAWSLGYPANTWWQTVWSGYSGHNHYPQQHHQGWQLDLSSGSHHSHGGRR